MKKIILVAVMLLNSHLSWAGSQVGNGGGLSEKYITVVYMDLASYIKQYLSGSQILGDQASEYSILLEIMNALPEEKANADQIQFRSEKLNPGFFDTGEPSRVAKTGDHVGDTIYINTDQLYAGGAPITIPIAIQILVHEMGHHHGISDHAFLDKIGSDVGHYIESATLVAKYKTALFDYTALYIGLSRPSLLVSNGQSVVNFGKVLGQQMGLCRETEQLERYAITNMFWSDQTAYSSSLPVTLRLQVRVVCHSLKDRENRIEKAREVALHLDQKPVLSERFELLSCRTSPERCW